MLTWKKKGLVIFLFGHLIVGVHFPTMANADEHKVYAPGCPVTMNKSSTAAPVRQSILPPLTAAVEMPEQLFHKKDNGQFVPSLNCKEDIYYWTFVNLLKMHTLGSMPSLHNYLPCLSRIRNKEVDELTIVFGKDADDSCNFRNTLGGNYHASARNAPYRNFTDRASQRIHFVVAIIPDLDDHVKLKVAIVPLMLDADRMLTACLLPPCNDELAELEVATTPEELHRSIGVAYSKMRDTIFPKGDYFRVVEIPRDMDIFAVIAIYIKLGFKSGNPDADMVREGYKKAMRMCNVETNFESKVDEFVTIKGSLGLAKQESIGQHLKNAILYYKNLMEYMTDAANEPEKDVTPERKKAKTSK